MRVSARVLMVALALGLLAGGADAQRKPAWTWAALHRPLHLAQLAPSAPCPVSAVHRVDLGPGEGQRAIPGPGPAYPAGLAPDVALEFVYPPDQRQVDFYGTGWGGNKVVWFVKLAYKGPVLIRGRQLDGPHRIRFERGSPPQAELRILPAIGYYRTHARGRASYTRLEAAGCYAYQIDGLGFSGVIVFQGRIVPAP